MNQLIPLIVIAGIGTDGKPHAAQFDAGHAKLAAKAARLMGFQIAHAESDAALAAAKALPRGKIYGSGRALAPIINQQLYDQFLALLPFERSSPKEPEPVQTKDGLPPDPWDQIAVGSVVLYGGKYIEDGWWEAIVESISKADDIVTMRWRGAPKERAFKCRRHELGIIGREALKSLPRV